MFVEFLYFKPIQLNDERWREFEAVDIEALDVQPLKSMLQEFNTLRQ